MTKLALKRGESDSYSEEKLERLKRKYPILRFTVYCTLRNFGLKDTEIKRMYAINNNSFQFFKGNHFNILKEVRKWD